jgi:methionine-rich copper-binding protein CopC
MNLPRLLSLLLLIFPLLLPGDASAHAIIMESSPAANAVLSGSVPIRLRFNSRVDHARSKLTLLAPDGSQTSLIPAADSPADALNAEAKDLAPGVWRLRWQVLSVDGHITRGDIPFTVK